MWRADDEEQWRRARTHLLPNDRWRAVLELPRVGRYRFAAQSWLDPYASFARSRSQARSRPGRDVRDTRRCRLNSRGNVSHERTDRHGPEQFVDAFEHLTAANRIRVLLAPETLEAMHRAGERKSLVRSREYVIEAERKAARFASWYELFPRSQSASLARSGTFRDTIERFPVLRDMGFDVLYLTPIHPIGVMCPRGRSGRSWKPLRDRVARRRDPGGFSRARHRSARTRNRNRARVRHLLLARPSLAQGASQLVCLARRRLDSICRESAKEIRGHRQYRFLCARRDAGGLDRAARHRALLG